MREKLEEKHDIHLNSMETMLVTCALAINLAFVTVLVYSLYCYI